MTRSIVLAFAFSAIVSFGCFSSKSENAKDETGSENEASSRYSYTTDSVYISVHSDSIFGILYTPIKEGKVPAVLCLQGGGSVGLDNYIYEAKYFAELGLTALVCDKSGDGLSKGPTSWRDQTFVDKREEYYELIQWLKGKAYVDSDRVGVHGMSEGGRLAIDLAATYPDEIAFSNSVSGPLQSYGVNQVYAIRNHLLNQGVDEHMVERTGRIWSRYFNEIAERNITQETLDEANKLRPVAGHRYFFDNSTELPRRPRPEDIHFSSAESIDDIKCPVLFQFGADDMIVNTEGSLKMIPPKPNFEIKHYLNTNHSMTLPNGDVHYDFLSDKKDWLESFGFVH